jgi:hypothetical protein
MGERNERKGLYSRAEHFGANQGNSGSKSATDTSRERDTVVEEGIRNKYKQNDDSPLPDRVLSPKSLIALSACPSRSRNEDCGLLIWRNFLRKV